jgi:hypothetical protein
MDNVVQFADLQFRAKQKRWPWEKDRCEHKKLVLDDNGEIVTCEDCKQQVGAYWALRHMVEVWGKHAETAKRNSDHLNSRIQENVSLLAAQKAEKAWRSRKMVPTCPHCHEAIFAGDGFGGSMVNKQIAERRRTEAATRSREAQPQE